MNASATIKGRLGWERGPAHVLIALAPGNPRGRPFITRHPHPADIAQTRPATVVVRCPTERLFGDPCPTCLGVDPAPVRVGTPLSRAFGRPWLENISVIRGFAPVAVRIKLRIKRAAGSLRGAGVSSAGVSAVAFCWSASAFSRAARSASRAANCCCASV